MLELPSLPKLSAVDAMFISGVYILETTNAARTSCSNKKNHSYCLIKYNTKDPGYIHDMSHAVLLLKYEKIELQ
jgi:hypothetical protein